MIICNLRNDPHESIYKTEANTLPKGGGVTNWDYEINKLIYIKQINEDLLCSTVLCLVAQSCLTLCDPMDCNSPGSSVHEDSPSKNTGVGCSALLQGIFPTQGSNPGLLHCRWVLYWLRHQGNPRILKWVVYPFSRGTSQPRNWTRVSCIAGGFFTSWAARKAEGTIFDVLK